MRKQRALAPSMGDRRLYRDAVIVEQGPVAEIPTVPRNERFN